jgi:hypothetical protein
MLQLSDTTYIKQVISPLSFKLVDGRVEIEIPAGLVTEVRDKMGKVTSVPYKFPMSQQEIEAKVLALKRIERIAAMAAHFGPHLSVLNSVALQSSQRFGSWNGRTGNGFDPSDPWQKWQVEFEAQLEKAIRPEQVVIQPFPLLPAWYQNRENLKDVAEKLGQTKNLFGSNAP